MKSNSKESGADVKDLFSGAGHLEDGDSGLRAVPPSRWGQRFYKDGEGTEERGQGRSLQSSVPADKHRPDH